MRSLTSNTGAAIALMPGTEASTACARPLGPHQRQLRLQCGIAASPADRRQGCTVSRGR